MGKKLQKSEKKQDSGDVRMIAVNRRAKFNYELIDRREAGIVLSGNEVKAVRAGHVSLLESYAKFIKDELYLVNAHIAPYQPKQPNVAHPSPTRSRKLLLHGNELARLQGKVKEQGLTLVPLSIYLKRNCVKVEVALAKGKRKHDKRESIKQRDTERMMRRVVKS